MIIYNSYIDTQKGMIPPNLALLLAILLTLLVTSECHYKKNYQKTYRPSKYWEQDSRYENYHDSYRRDDRKYSHYDNRRPSRDYQYTAYKKKVNNKKVGQNKKTALPHPKDIKASKIQKKLKKPIKDLKQQAKYEIKTETITTETITVTPVTQDPKSIIQEEINVMETVSKIIEEIQNSKEPTPDLVVNQNVEAKIQCNDKAVYDYNLLVLTWVPEECYADIDCQKDWQTYDDLRSPTIHAFRPYGSSSYYENCFQVNGDPNCLSNAYMMNFQIDEALWNVTGLIYEISQYWPALKFTHDEQRFYFRQWFLHGTCYLMNMIEDNPNAYKNDRAGFNRTIMIEYFRTAISKFKKLAIDVQPGAQYREKEEFAEDIGFKGKETHFVLMCNDRNQIVEIIFCFNRSKLPGKEVTIPCTLDDTCDESKVFSIKKPK